MTMLALTVRQPWAWAIAHGGKDVENRSWVTTHRGLLAIHAGIRGRWDKDGQTSPMVRQAWIAAGRTPDTLTKTTDLMQFGAVVAVATVTECHPDLDHAAACSLWAAEWSWHWSLADVVPLDHPVICTGRLGVWQLPHDVEIAVRYQIERTPTS